MISQEKVEALRKKAEEQDGVFTVNPMPKPTKPGAGVEEELESQDLQQLQGEIVFIALVKIIAKCILISGPTSAHG